jgi:hypothetical protein
MERYENVVVNTYDSQNVINLYSFHNKMNYSEKGIQRIADTFEK